MTEQPCCSASSTASLPASCSPASIETAHQFESSINFPRISSRRTSRYLRSQGYAPSQTHIGVTADNQTPAQCRGSQRLVRTRSYACASDVAGLAVVLGISFLNIRDPHEPVHSPRNSPEESDIPVSQASPSSGESDTGRVVGPRWLHSTMTTAAYLRVSTGQQSIDQQHEAIAAAGITPDRVFTTPRPVALVTTDRAGRSALVTSARAITSWSSP